MKREPVCGYSMAKPVGEMGNLGFPQCPGSSRAGLALGQGWWWWHCLIRMEPVETTASDSREFRDVVGLEKGVRLYMLRRWSARRGRSPPTAHLNCLRLSPARRGRVCIYV